jgi:hypothetical protein
MLFTVLTYAAYFVSFFPFHAAAAVVEKTFFFRQSHIA